MKYFQNESEVEMVGDSDLSFENRTDRISISGGIDITKDQTGLKTLQTLIQKLQEIAIVLKNEEATLPVAIEITPAKLVENPFLKHIAPE